MKYALLFGVLALAVGARGVFLAGKYSAREDTAKAETAAVKKDVAGRTRTEIEVHKMSDDELDRAFAEWMRND